MKEFNGRWELTLIDLTRWSVSFDVSLGPSQLSVYNDCNLQKTQITSYYLQSLPLAMVSKGCRYTGFHIYIGEQAKNCTTSGNTVLKYFRHSPAQPVIHTLEKIPQNAAMEKHPHKPFWFEWRQHHDWTTSRAQPGQSLGQLEIYCRGVGI